jgi:RNA polymerase sigma-70 factor, ECF subfamily
MKRTDVSETALERLQTRENHLQSLFVQALAGNEASYHAFLLALSTHLRAFFKRRLTSLIDEVEDLVQETLLAVHNQRHSYQSDLPLTAWVQAIARHKLIDLFRRRAVRENLHDPLDDELAVFAHNDLEAQDAKRDLAKLLKQLPDPLRLPIEHMKLQGFSVTETAQATGMSESAVKVGVHRGLKALSALIEKTKQGKNST